MTLHAALQGVVFLVVLTALALPLGSYMARVYAGEARFAQRILGPIERLLYRAAGVREDDDQSWKKYAACLLAFNLLGALVVYALARLQHSLPLNPAGLGPVSPQVSFNTAASFASNTNWQSYGGESTLSHLTQMLGLTVQNFVSAATGMAVLVALVRGFTRRKADGIGNSWVDLTKSTLYILLPLSLVLAVLLVSQGVVQTLTARIDVALVDPSAVMASGDHGQVLAVGPAASQVAIKQLALATSASEEKPGFILAVSLWLWFTVVFANFAEAMAEGRGKAQADTLRKARKQVSAKRLAEPRRDAAHEVVASAELHKGDIVLVEAGDLIPSDGEVVEGVASVDESAITGESAPVIRESGGDRSAVTGGTRVLSDWLIVRISAEAGETFLDRMIKMVEGAKRQKTPNEIALDILLAALTIVFLLATVTLSPFSHFAVDANGQGAPVSMTVLVALLVCLIPTTIGGLLSAIGIAGMDRMIQANVIATSGRAVEAAGDVDTLLLDKTGTITLGNRQASAFLPAPGVEAKELADAAQLASLADETPEGRSIVVFAKEQYGLRGRDIAALGATFVPFTAQTRMSGVDLDGRRVRKGAGDAIERWLVAEGGAMPAEVRATIEEVSKRGSTPLVVADGHRPLGVVELKDVVKGGIKERFGEMRRLGIRTIMITGDNQLTAAAIAAEAGVDDFLAEATPEAKLAMIRDYQAKGHLVAMTGDGTNDAPALAQADVAVAMNTGTQAAKEAGNMVDLDSNPTKLLSIVEIGKQMLMTRGSLTTFSIANDVAKYFAIIPAAFAGTYPVLDKLNLMGLHSPTSAIMSAVIFNALIIIALIPLALRGIKYRPAPASQLLRRNLLVYGLGGVILPFPGIKLIDLFLTATRLV